jgi:hypothetical protein
LEIKMIQNVPKNKLGPLLNLRQWGNSSSSIALIACKSGIAASSDIYGSGCRAELYMKGEYVDYISYIYILYYIYSLSILLM